MAPHRVHPNQPHKPKLLPFAASVATQAFSPQQTRLPQLYRECPTLRALTTTFRSDGQTMAPYLRRCLLAPLQSVVRSPSRTSHTIAGKLHLKRSLLYRSRSLRLSPTKRLFRSPTRPIPAAAPRMRAPLLYKPHQSYKPSFKPLPTKPPLSRFLHCLGFNLASPMLCGNAAEQSGRPRSCGCHSVRQQHRPAAARRPATTFKSPCARVVFQPQLLRQLRKYE